MNSNYGELMNVLVNYRIKINQQNWDKNKVQNLYTILNTYNVDLKTCYKLEKSQVPEPVSYPVAPIL